jgi:CHAT domain-containing protein/Tfp pilus assembly protein PilF
MNRGCIVVVLLLAVQIGFFFTEPAWASGLQDTEKLKNQVERLYQEGRYGDNIPLALEALSALEKTYGPNPSEAITVIKYLAKSYSRMGEPSKAAQYYARELTLLEQAYGPSNDVVLVKRNILSKLYIEIGEYEPAVPLLEKALDIREKNLGPDHKNVAVLLDRLATAHQGLGEYKKAEQIYIRALSIREKSLGPEHLDVAVSLNNLGAVFFFQGKYDQALPLYVRALGIFEKALGPEHPQVASCHNNLAELYRAMGDYAKTEEHFQSSINIWKKSGRTQTKDYAATLNNMAEFYRTLGAFPAAEKMYKQALATMERLYTTNHPDYAKTLNNLALLYQDLGQCEETIPLFNQVRTTWEKTLGPEHPLVALSLNNLSISYLCLKRYSEAANYLEQALPLLKTTLGPGHPQLGVAFNNAAGVYESQGRFKQADEYYGWAQSIFEKNFGAQHPDVSLCLHNRARLNLGTGNVRKGLELYAQAQEIDQKLIDQVIGFAPEERQLKFLTAKRDDLHVFLSLVVQTFLKDPKARVAALDAWLRRKGLLLQAQRRFQEALVYSGNREAVQTFQELGRCRAELSKLLLGGPGAKSPERYRDEIAALEQKRAELEARLIKLSQRFAKAQKASRVDAEQVAGLLPPESVLLEFARIDMFDFKASVRRPAHYLAFVLHAGKGERVGLFDLGRVEAIDETIARLRDAVIDPELTDQLNVEARALYDKAFSPVMKELGQSSEIFISPDGDLNLVPFEILQGPDNRYLIEDFSFNYLNSGRDLLGFEGKQEGTGRSLLIGDPDFDSAVDSRDTGQNRNARSRDLRDLQFDRLPGTLAEVQAIVSILGQDRCTLKTGPEAGESALAGMESPRILHFATHGFFLTDQQLDYIRGERPFGFQFIGLPGSTGPSGFENLLVRSGLALAGANRTLRSSGIQHSDGLLTAEKVLGLRLQNTDLVVLSACETGVGEVKSGEGVYGLRRAFIQAGAKGLVMSLWPIPDQETKELMVAFYNYLSKGKMNRAKALRQAILDQMRVTKKRYGISHPLFWGAFIYLGEPGRVN